MEMSINGMNVAMLATEGVEQAVLADCKKAIEAEGGLPRVVSDRHNVIRTTEAGKPAGEIPVELLLNKVDATAFDALFVLGGDLRNMAAEDREEAQRLIESFLRDGKPVAAMSEGAALLDTAEEGDAIYCGSAAEAPACMDRFITAIAERMQANLRGKPDENAVGIASS